MEEHCVFCGAPIPDDAVYCHDCAKIVESLDPDRRRVLEGLLADSKSRALLCEAWEQVKEAMAAALEIVINVARYVADWLIEKEEGEA